MRRKNIKSFLQLCNNDEFNVLVAWKGLKSFKGEGSTIGKPPHRNSSCEHSYCAICQYQACFKERIFEMEAELFEHISDFFSPLCDI